MANLATISNNILADSGIDPIDLIVGTGTVNYVPKFTAEGTIGNSQIFDNGTNVGIGTASPSYKLDVIGSFSFTTGGNYLQYNSGILYHGNYYQFPSGNNYLLFARASGDLVFGANDVERMRITSAGNVGIGTTSPTEKLHVNGDTRIVGNTYVGGIINAYQGDASIWVPNLGQAFTVKQTTGNVGIGTTAPGGKLDVIGTGIFGTMTSTRGLYSNGLSLQNNTGEATSLFLWQSGVASAHIGSPANSTSLHIVNSYNTGLITDPNAIVLTNTGNVGIGTTSPNEKLHVNGVVRSDNYYNILGNDVYFGSGSGLLYGGSSSDAVVRSGSNVHLAIGGYTKLIVNSSGNVGIGTTNTYENLTVSNSTGASIGLGTGGNAGTVASPLYTYFNFRGYGDYIKAQIVSYDVSANLVGGVLIFAVQNTSAVLVDYMRISSTGAIRFNAYGSGSFTGTPTYNLAVDANGNIIETAGGVVDGSGTANYVTKWIDANTVGNSQIFDNGTNVGIGTASPAYKLDVNGAARIGSNFIIDSNGDVYQPTTGGAALWAATANATYPSYGFYGDTGIGMYRAAADTLAFSTNDSERMRISSAGNVGIGTSSPVSPLDVNGILSSRGIFIAQNSGTYNLIYNASNSIAMYIGGSADPATYYDNLYHYFRSTAGSTTYGVWNSTGLGVGTSSPSTKLHVVGYVRTDGGMIVNGSDANYREIIFTTSSASRWNLYTYGAEGGGNSGSVLFLARYADNGDYIANVATFLRTNGYVGIATTSPTEQLHVSGNLRVTGAYYDSNNSAGTSGQVLSSTATGTDWVSLSEITGVDGTGTANYVAKWLDANTITNSLLYDNGTTVAIGTTATNGSRLQVQGNTDIWHSLNTLLRLYHDGTRAVLQSYTGGGYSNIALNADGGNVGIGTSSPTSKLQVLGTGRTLNVVSTNDQAAASFGSSGYAVSTIGFYGVGSANDYNVRVGASVDAFVAYTNDTERMRITAAGEVLIGGTSAGVNGLLQVSGSIGLSGNTQIRQATNGDGNTLQIFATQFVAGPLNSISYSYTGGGLIASVSAGDGALLFDSGRNVSTEGRVKIANTTSGNTSFSIEKNGETTLFASTVGNVGIGTTASLSRLTILSDSAAQTISLIGRAADGISTIRWWNNAGNAVYTAIESNATYTIYNTVTNGYAAFFTNNTERMRITSIGRVGIGTSNPATKLHVVNTADVAIIGDGNDNYFGNYTSGDYFDIGNLGSTGNVFLEGRGVSTNINSQYRTKGAGSHIWTYNSGNNEIMRTTSTGNVGIGTTDPQYKLDVAQVIRSKYGSNEGGLYLGGTPAGVAYAAGAIRATPSPSYSYTGKLSFYTTTWGVGSDYGITEQMYIDTTAADTKASTLVMLPWGGNVGIGTTSPTSILDASVSSGATSGFRFKGWSDASTPYLLSLGTQTYQDIFQIKSVNGLVTMGIVGAVGSTPDLAFQTNSTERMRINSSGQLLVGTSSGYGSNGKVVVQNGTIVGASSNWNNSTTGNAIEVFGDNNSNGGTIWASANGNQAWGNISISPLGGNVGIGIYVPAAKLHVVETSNSATTYPLIINNQNNQAGDGWGAGIKFSTSNPLGGGNEGLKWSSIQAFDVNNYGSSSGLSFTVSETYNKNTAMVINRYGAVGIGNTTPLRNLHVAGNFAVNANGSQYYGVYIPANGEGASPTILIGDWWNASGNLTWDSSNKIFNINSLYGSNAAPITFSGNGTERMRITTAGDVGIGISSPITKLQVAGGVTVGSSSTAIVNFYMTRNNGGVAADANYFVSANNTPNHTWIEGGYYTGELSGVVTAPNSGYPYIETWAGQGGSTTKSFGFINKTSGSFTAADLFVTMSLARTGLVRFNQYGTGAFTGTRAYDLSVDASGNIIEVPVGAGTITGSGTANYIPRFTSSSAIGNSNIYDDGTNVGISTTSPLYRLDIGGTARAQGITLTAFATGTSGGNLELGFDGAQGVVQAYNRSTPAWIPLYLSGSDVRFNPGGVEKMRLTSTGNLGIETSSPATKFTIGAYVGSRLPYINGTTSTFNAQGITVTSSNTANANIGGGLDLTNNVHSVGSYSPLISFSALSQSGLYNNNYAAIYGVLAGDSGDGNWNTGHIAFATTTAYGTSEKVRITSAGNVGIGTTTPSYKLVVNGAEAGLYVNGAEVAPYTQKIAVFRYGGNGNSVNIENQAGKASIQGRVDSGAVMDLILNAAGGNVGIGTGSPQTGVKLDVYGAAAVAGGSEGLRIGNVGDNTAYDNIKIYYTGYSGGAPRVYMTPRTTPGSGVVNTFFHLQNTNGSSTTSNNTMGLIVDGNVGIGTSTPTARLSLGAASQGNRITWEDYSNIFSEYSSGDIWLSSNFYGNLGSSGYVTSVTASYGAAGISVSGTGGGLNGVIKFFVDNAAAKTAGAAFVPSERMRINGSGNVLIGTTSDVGSKLYVDGGIRASGALLSGGILEFTGAWSASPYNGSAWVRPPAGVGVFLVNNAITRWAGFKPNNDFVVNSDNLLVQSSTGYVGIGTGSPSQQLHVAQNMAFGLDGGTAGDVNNIYFTTVNGSHTSTINGIYYTKKGNWGGQIDIRTSYDWGYSGVDNARISLNGLAGNGIAFCTGASLSGSSERMRITSDGEILINTTSDAGNYKLQVNGNIYSSGDEYLEGALYIQNGGGGNAQIYGSSADGVLRIRNNNIYVPQIQFLKSNGTVMFDLNNGVASFTGSVTATGFFESSDARLKTIVDENYRHNAIANIKPKFYEKNGKFEAGYIAQDVQEIYEHAVSLGTDGYLSLSYGQIHTLKIAYLEDTVEEIKRKIAYLEQQLNNK